MILIALCLPETGTVAVSAENKIELNKDVYKTALIGVVEMLFFDPHFNEYFDALVRKSGGKRNPYQEI